MYINEHITTLISLYIGLPVIFGLPFVQVLCFTLLVSAILYIFIRKQSWFKKYLFLNVVYILFCIIQLISLAFVIGYMASGFLTSSIILQLEQGEQKGYGVGKQVNIDQKPTYPPYFKESWNKNPILRNIMGDIN